MTGKTHISKRAAYRLLMGVSPFAGIPVETLCGISSLNPKIAVFVDSQAPQGLNVPITCPDCMVRFDSMQERGIYEA